MGPTKILSYAYLFSLAAEPKKASGFLFICLADDSILLALRAPQSYQPNVWTGLGGGLEAGETPMEAAIRETQEEAGSMPKDYEIITELKYKDSEIIYTTFVANLSEQTKKSWKPKPDMHENVKIEWFHKLPKNLHPKLAYTLKEWLNESS